MVNNEPDLLVLIIVGSKCFHAFLISPIRFRDMLSLVAGQEDWLSIDAEGSLAQRPRFTMKTPCHRAWLDNNSTRSFLSVKNPGFEITVDAPRE